MLKSLFIPTPNILTYSNYYLIQLLAKERVVCMMESKPFIDRSEELVTRYLDIPVHFQKQGDTEQYVKTEAKMIFAGFSLLEKEPSYVSSLSLLNQYIGQKYTITSLTTTGIMVIFETPDAA